MKKFIYFIALLLILVTLFSLMASAPVASALTVPKQSESSLAVPYNGKIYHIFFHSFIIYPELAFNSPRAKGYRDWMVTRGEFKEILNRLYENDFSLIDINYVRDCIINNRPLMFYSKKKPLILSVDDVNYYDYMKNDGFAEKLIVDENGVLAATVRTKDGSVIDYEGDIFPVVEDFVKSHPDFSFNNAKGIIAVTGYQGVFGYRISRDTHDIENAKKVAWALKINGWRIACHSFGHSIGFKDGSISFERLKRDTEKWNSVIAPITGPINIYISPFGMHMNAGDNRFKYLIESGFNIYCPVYKKMNITVNNGCMISQRLNFDGFTLRNYPERIEREFFSAKGILER
ncbi:MAG: hypothetical protein WBM21_03265 [Christensenellales bacterium]